MYVANWYIGESACRSSMIITRYSTSKCFIALAEAGLNFYCSMKKKLLINCCSLCSQFLEGLPANSMLWFLENNLSWQKIRKSLLVILVYCNCNFHVATFSYTQFMEMSFSPFCWYYKWCWCVLNPSHSDPEHKEKKLM